MRASIRWLVFGVLMGLSAMALAKQATLRDARLLHSKNRTRIVFDLSGNTHPDLFMIDNPLRLVVDLPDTRAASAVDDDQSGGGMVKRIRTGVRHGTALRIVLDLSAMVDPKSFMLDPRGDRGYRLVVDLYPQGSAPPARLASMNIAFGADANPGDDKGASDPVPPAVSKGGTADSSPAAPESGSRSTPIGYVPQRPTRDIVIAIDPGHGGKDPGARGPHGTLEKNITLAIARRLKRMVDEQPHMHAVLTRKGDYYVGLRERMIDARKAKADFFISIHCDASPDGRGADGASVYALSHHGATSEHARWLARRENAADLVGGVSIKNKNKSLASFMLDLSQSASIEASLDAGHRVLEDLDGLGSLHKSKVQQAGFMVLKSPDIPSILVETNFISNPREERKLNSARYQNRLAAAMLQGIKGYFASYRPATLIAGAQQHLVKPGETLSGIALEYGVSVDALRDYNKLDDNVIRANSRLRIPPPQNPQIAALQ